MNMNQDNQAGGGMMKLFGHAKGGPAAVLRAVAGIPAGVARTRRGTFMVVVIGTLALLAVIAIAHFAVSQSDRRASAALVRSSRVDEVPDQVARYLQNVIVRDLFVNVPEELSDLLTSAQAARFIARRESVDRPSTDWRSISTDNRLTVPSNGLQMPNRQYFTPEGVGSDPWLADIAPQWLNWTGDAPAAGANTEFQYRRDWGKISNFGPDGRFVNLANLRNSFAAEPGFGVDASGKPRTSEGLSLLNWNPNNVAQRATRIFATDFGLAAGPGTVASRRPAVWDSRQRGAYRPAKEWSSLLPSDIGYADNEWVDTDGDGMLDARWFELIDARDLGTVQNFLTTDGKLRWFVAARAIDLSGLVNVNTATDQRYEPGMAYPIGVTPADIDLKRLLTLTDSYDQWGFGYNNILQPAVPLNSRRASNYRGYDETNAFNMGVGAYDSIRWAIKSVLVEDRYANAPWDWAGNGFSTKEGALRHASWRVGASSLTGASFASGEVTLPAFFPTSDMGELLARFGANNPDETSRLEAATDGRFPAVGGGAIPRQQFAYGPMRSNRDEGLETNRTSRTTPAGAVVDTGQVTPEAMLHSVVDVRSQLTTVSGSREIPSMLGSDQTNYPYSSWATQIIADKDSKLQLGSIAAEGTDADGGELFRAYVRALAPAIKMPGVWPTGSVLPGGGGPAFQARKTLFYGHQGPELALTVAGSMAVNAETLFSANGTLSQPRTLVFDADLALLASDDPTRITKSAAQNVPLVPWLRGSMGYCLDPVESDDRVLATTAGGKQLQTPALHLYGFEPQVFITEVGCYTVWRDTPRSGGGDNDQRPFVIGQPPNGFITINGDMNQSNPDYLFRCVAFQIHNPFDEDVVISTGFPNNQFNVLDTAGSFHYVRVKNADQRGTSTSNFALFDTEITAPDTFVLRSMTIRAGETIVCYGFGELPNRVAERLRVTGVVADFNAGKQYMKDWAEKQFTSAGSPDRVVERAFMVVQADENISRVDDRFAGSVLIDDPNATNGMAVQLWKTRRADMTEYGGPNELASAGNPLAPNLTDNDQLVDRFRVQPNTTTLDARIKAGNNDVDGCYGGREAGPFDQFNFNSGVTLMRWTTMSRPSDPLDGASGTIPLGGLPAYCLEPKLWGGTDWHKEFNEDSGVSPKSSLEVTKDVIERLKESGGGNGPADFVTSDWVRTSRNNAFSSTVWAAPRNKSSVPTIANNLDGDEFKVLRDLIPRSARGDKGFGGVNPVFGTELPGSPAPKASTLRVADLLLPMAISPWESPLCPDFTEQKDPNIRHLTASEAFAVAYGYETIPSPSAVNDKADPLSMYAKAPAAPNSDGNFGDTNPRAVIVRGHVVLDDFAPFYDGNRDGVFNRNAAYNGIDLGSAASSDIRFGLGIPAALGILDQVSAFETSQGSAIRPVSGLININTAPASVMRTLPLVTPANNTGLPSPLLWNNTWTQTKENIDLVASIIAYRDKNIAIELTGRVAPARFIGDEAASRPHIGVAGGNATASTERQLGRALTTQIDGIREETGFGSTGELMCVLQRQRDDHGGITTTRDEARSLDFHGFNNQSRLAAGEVNDRKGINSLHFKDSSGALATDEVRNDFAERLQIMSALSNVTTVRSDVFAVWFVVRGYSQEDTENLGPDDPMTPSIERRFVMVIDRSGVTSLKGTNKPRVLLLKEVPR